MIALSYRIIICLIIISVREGESLECWSCSSIYEPACEDPFKPSDLTGGAVYFLMDCRREYLLNGTMEDQELMDHVLGPDAKPYCRKRVRKIYGMTIVNRGCSIGDEDKDCSNGRGSCENLACYENGCNAAADLSRISLLFTPIITLLLF
ncbi:uncharacterized protein LOC125242251 [Leguminivora glycinivorella]|uniref:uncharacterized protein LOC125242251 n=1 Tax=Leguminivora glycinivorella TaxID=1035111 RepID=UPI002010536B|nr:uncharacterized protein LOC125242251 [Leguminivora glycinivorella]